jgi:PBSX family phage terminase large subunit
MPVVNIELDDEIFLEVYRHLVHDTEFFDIDFLYGGRDSGKSRHIAMQLVIDCMRQKYFKCLLVRKVLNTVRSSQYDLIKSVIDEWGLKHLFTFNETRLEIICKANKNGFYGRGLDDVGRIKSFNNPSHCWIEEGNQITSEDFVVILTSLRANQQVKTWFSFNPECDGNYTDFWLYKEYFEHTTKLSFTWTKVIDVPDVGEVPFKIRVTHSTYKDNPYCKPQRKALYEGYKNSKNNAYWYQVYTLGLWGFRRTGGSFWKCFDEIQHTRSVGYVQDALHITLDNNSTPYITVGIWQVDMANKVLKQIDELPCEYPNNTASKAAKKTLEWLLKQGHEGIVFIYGDPSANAKSTEDDEGRSFFDKYLGEFAKTPVRYVNRVGKSAPGVAISGGFINEIYESNYEGWSIVIDTKCRKSIEDYTMTKEDMNGGILKTKEKNKDTGQTFERYGHFSDAKRYFITTLLPSEFATYSTRQKKFYGYSN